MLHTIKRIALILIMLLIAQPLYAVDLGDIIAQGTGVTITDNGTTISVSNSDRGAASVSIHESTYTHANYDTAYGWGDHSTAGYIASTSLDSLAELDTQIGLTGTADNTTYLRGDGAWATPTGEGSGIASVAADANPDLGGNLDTLGYTISSSTGNVIIDDSLTVTGDILTSIPIIMQVAFDLSKNGSYLAYAPMPYQEITITDYRIMLDEPISEDLTVSLFRGATELTTTKTTRATVDDAMLGLWIDGLSHNFSSTEYVGIKLQDYTEPKDLTATGYIQIWATVKDGK